MAYDEELADRIRDLIVGTADVCERRMFGGLAFLVNGQMAVTVSRQGGLMARVGAEGADALLERAGVEPMVMRGRPMRGWVRVGAELVGADTQLQEWVDRCLAFVETLPPKA